MTLRFERVRIELDLYEDFEGRRTIKFEYTPEPDDPLVNIALAKNRELIEAELAANPKLGPDFS